MFYLLYNIIQVWNDDDDDVNASRLTACGLLLTQIVNIY